MSPPAKPTAARRERFRALYEANYAPILGYALRRCPDPDDAADVVSETFVVAWRRLDAIPVDDARPWLYGTARRVLSNQRRGSRRHRQLGDRLREDLKRAAPATPEVEGRLGCVGAAFSRLSFREREVIALAAWEGLGAAELGQALGCSPTAARIRLHRARARLKRYLQDESGPDAAKHRLPGGQILGKPKEDPT